MDKKILWYIVLVVIVVGAFVFYKNKQSSQQGINGTADVYDSLTPPPITPPITPSTSITPPITPP